MWNVCAAWTNNPCVKGHVPIIVTLYAAIMFNSHLSSYSGWTVVWHCICDGDCSENNEMAAVTCNIPTSTEVSSVCSINFPLKEAVGRCIRVNSRDLKMGRGAEQKYCDVLYVTAVNIDFRSLEMPPLPINGTFKLMSWTFACRLNIIECLKHSKQ